MKQANFFFLAIALITFLIFLLLSNWRWKLLLESQNIKFSFFYLFQVYLIAWLFNNILPTTIGGDLARIAYTVKKNESSAFAAAFVDRFIGFIGLFFFALVASAGLFLTQSGKSQFLLLNLLGFIILVVILLGLFSNRIHQFFSLIFTHIKLFKLGQRFERAYTQIKQYRQNKITLILSFILSLVVQFFSALAWFALALSLMVQTSLLYFCLYIPVIGVLTMIPITIGGLGWRENLFVKMFSARGIESTTALAISLLFLVVNFIFATIGGIVFLFMKKQTNSKFETKVTDVH